MPVVNTTTLAVCLVQLAAVLVVRLDSVGLSETCYKHFIWCDNPVITLCDWRKSKCGFICVALDAV